MNILGIKLSAHPSSHSMFIQGLKRYLGQDSLNRRKVIGVITRNGLEFARDIQVDRP